MFTLWSFYTLLYFVEFCIILQQSITVCDYQQFIHVTTEYENRNFAFGLSNFNIIPLLHKILNFVSQHHTDGISYTSININGYFQGICVLCKQTISLANFTSFFSLQVKYHMLTGINFLKITYIPIIYMIADSLRKIHISENREKITVQRLIYV